MSVPSHHYESEEDTKSRAITPALKTAGWSSQQIVMEYSLKADRFRIVPDLNTTVRESSRCKPDYILFRDINCPLAVVEAKRRAKSSRDGIDQAIAYARLLDVPFAYASSGNDFLEFELPTGKQRTIPMDKFPSPAELVKRWCALRNVGSEEEETLTKAQYHTSQDGFAPRYYQMQAINRTIEAIVAHHRKRVLLVMATGTGKTYTAFQIVWRLKKAGVVRNVLYLADRNQLIDQTMVDDFAPFNTAVKIARGKINQNYEIYFGLYQQLKGDQTESMADHYKQVPPDYFDLIIVDECHRGSAREQSSWRDILDYFSSAIQIGMTATPNEKDGSNNLDYFGKPLLTYSLKQGIEDGFLAPYQVVSVTLDKDVTGWEPAEGERDIVGKILPQRKFYLCDFDTVLELKSRTRVVADCITRYLKHLGRMSKTIVFCTTQHHAASMRDALREANEDLVAEEPNYVVRMTADDEDGKDLYEDFISVNRPYPVVVTTSKLLTTGANTKCVKLIVLDTNIRSMTEFKQIIGRGTRLRPDAGKTFFTILDFRGVCQLFSDPEFDGEADNTINWSGEGDPPGRGDGDDPQEIERKRKRSTDCEKREMYVVDNVPVSVIGSANQYLDENGNLVTEKFVDYTRRNILAIYGTDRDFCEVWNGEKAKKTILEELAAHGVSFEQMRRELGDPDLDEFDMIRHIAFGSTNMFTRRLRADKVRRTRFFDKYQGLAREVLERLLDTYATHGISEIEDLAALSTHCHDIGGMKKIVQSFGGRDAVLGAIREMEGLLYEPAV